MLDVSGMADSRPLHFRTLFRTAAVCAAAGCMSLPQAAMAQDGPSSGPYAVARAGVQVDSDLRFPSADRTAPSTFSKSADLKRGFVGELGLGYDFDGFRLETTVGAGSAKVNGKRIGDRNNVVTGRIKSLDLGVAGYVDLPLSETVKPFVGAGIGLSRVNGRLSKVTTPATAGAAAVTTMLRDRDWAFRWHLDAGVGFALTPSTALEIGGRYTRTSGLKLDGTAGVANGQPLARAFKPRQSATSIMFGVRQKF